MHLVVRGTRKLSGKGQIIWWELTNRCPEVILIEVVDSTSSPPNSIALKCKIICHPPHTNCCCICFLISVTNLVHQLPISTVFTVLFCHQSHLIMLKIIRSCVYIIAGALEKGTISNKRLPWSFERHENVNNLFKDMEMWANLPAIIPWCSDPIRTNDIINMCTKSSNKMQNCLILTVDNIFRSKFDICKF